MISITSKEAKENSHVNRTDVMENFEEITDELITLVIRDASIDNNFVDIDFDKFVLHVLRKCGVKNVNRYTTIPDLSVIIYFHRSMTEQLKALGFKCEWDRKNTLHISWES